MGSASVYSTNHGSQINIFKNCKEKKRKEKEKEREGGKKEWREIGMKEKEGRKEGRKEARTKNHKWRSPHSLNRSYSDPCILLFPKVTVLEPAPVCSCRFYFRIQHLELMRRD
jgi:hypothetical protein